MTSAALDRFFRSFLDIDALRKNDSSMNGLQVDNDGSDIIKLAFAVDACQETIDRAATIGAGLLFVHHGIFWGRDRPISGGHRQRIATLLKRNIALYAVHLPLDQHPKYGNNGVLAERLGLIDIEPFGEYHGIKIGYKGSFASQIDTDEAMRRVSFLGRPPLSILPFGPPLNKNCAVISGGATQEIKQAIDEKIDLCVTGEISHEVYHEAIEAGLNIVAAGHYTTEVWGVRAVMAYVAEQCGLETEFIDVPTGL